MLQAQIIDEQGQYVDTLFHDHINRQAEDFVKLSLLISEPSQGLFTAMGHTAFHLECPTFGLDYVYHYAQIQEDSLSSLTRSYLLGKFVVAMVVDSFSTYMNYSNINKQGIYEYALHITPQEKQRLWEILDNEVARGGYLKYDFFQEGCAIMMARMLQKAIEPKKIDYSRCNPLLNRPRYEIVSSNMGYAPWARFCMLVAMCGKSPHKQYAEHLIFPKDLADAWQVATIDGHQVAEPMYELSKHWYYHSDVWLTPLRLAIIILILALVNLCIKAKWLDWFLLGIQVLMSLFVLFVVIKDYAPIAWNWLLIPFNLLPAIAWYWRKYWALPYAIVVSLWVLAMIFVPHLLVDWTQIILCLSFILLLGKQWLLEKRILTKKN